MPLTDPNLSVTPPPSMAMNQRLAAMYTPGTAPIWTQAPVNGWGYGYPTSPQMNQPAGLFPGMTTPMPSPAMPPPPANMPQPKSTEPPPTTSTFGGPTANSTIRQDVYTQMARLGKRMHSPVGDMFMGMAPPPPPDAPLLPQATPPVEEPPFYLAPPPSAVPPPRDQWPAHLNAGQQGQMPQRSGPLYGGRIGRLMDRRQGTPSGNVGPHQRPHQGGGGVRGLMGGY